ncbi:thioesterase-like superfamily-domain-containing protein [Phycomyces blakesleeanus]|uniref:Thioesterase-like superfamily-domain-containing protein n=1 Tax=Phycomyces blakesleeanus TaxID=4837 RepID=A0ABR3B9Z5_PHYBL
MDGLNLTNSTISAFDKGTNTQFIGKSASGALYYVGHASLQWSIGQVPNVSYVVSIMLDSVLQRYEKLYQKHPISLNCFFLRKTIPGPILIEIEDIKMSGKGYCLSRAVLKQLNNFDDPMPTNIDEYDPAMFNDKIQGVFTMGNMLNEQGVTVLHKPLTPPSRENLEPFKYIFMGDMVNSKIDHSMLPKSDNDGVQTPGTPEHHHLISFSDNRSVDFKSIPYWCDMFITPAANLGTDVWGGSIWCATMQMEIQFKRIPTGKEVLCSFITPHIMNSRLDLDGGIWDEDNNLLAVTRHQCLALPFSRNTPNVSKL